MIRPPHPFARFVQILGRGKTRSRSLTIEEAQEAMSMVLAGEVLPEQLGAFLMLLRMKEESPEEIAGFVRAARARMAVPPALPPASLGATWIPVLDTTQPTGLPAPSSTALPAHSSHTLSPRSLLVLRRTQ